MLLQRPQPIEGDDGEGERCWAEGWEMVGRGGGAYAYDLWCFKRPLVPVIPCTPSPSAPVTS